MAKGGLSDMQPTKIEVTERMLSRKLLELSSILEQKEQFVSIEKEIKGELLKLMKTERIPEFEAHGLRAELIYSRSVMVIDTVKLKAVAPELYHGYSIPVKYPDRIDIKKSGEKK